MNGWLLAAVVIVAVCLIGIGVSRAVDFLRTTPLGKPLNHPVDLQEAPPPHEGEQP